jgi:hypothetical protein
VQDSQKLVAYWLIVVLKIFVVFINNDVTCHMGGIKTCTSPLQCHLSVLYGSLKLLEGARNKCATSDKVKNCKNCSQNAIVPINKLIIWKIIDSSVYWIYYRCDTFMLLTALENIYMLNKFIYYKKHIRTYLIGIEYLDVLRAFNSTFGSREDIYLHIGLSP